MRLDLKEKWNILIHQSDVKRNHKIIENPLSKESISQENVVISKASDANQTNSFVQKQFARVF